MKNVVKQMLSGYNCTIFAYGQTGTGKTYTMSGDLTESMGMLSDNAGIIPRVLQALFNKLELEEREHSVRCSFIELYNEELRDLLSSDDNAKLKIYDDNSRKGHSTTMVQGMEERFILNAGEGLKWLREGSVKRQVAATKCNDLSSRSHTVFTITVYAKQKTENGKTESGDDYLMLGKLNLVDLAGSENIQRSGAENKRAAEAGLINKSLLTLGRVINALVDRSPHIPYRESKLTRLLQDSLGGHTKTCIIATISPAKSNLEETISTLDYAFRAKNIRNKPQLNALTNKKTLLRDYAIEIERLKAELIATRQRNGVYLSNEMYEELTVQNESRRILTEEQGAKIETLETNLKNKLQELLSVTSNFMGLKKEHEGTLARFDETKELLEETERVLSRTRQALAEESHLRKAHETTEEQLALLGGNLISTLERTVGDIDGLRAKDERRVDLHDLNRSTWEASQARVADITELVEGRIEAFRQGQEEHISTVSQRMQAFVKEELEKLSSTQTFLDENLARFAESKAQLVRQQERSKEEMDTVLEEIKVVRDNVKQRVGESLQAIAAAAERIAGDVLGELSTFHEQLHASYSSLGKDFKSAFEELLRHMRVQKAESDRLRQELEEATHAMVESNESVATRIQELLDEERAQAAAERQALLAQIARLVNSQAELQESRLADRAAQIQDTILDSSKALKESVGEYSAGMNAWGERDNKALEEASASKDALKTRLKDDWAVRFRFFSLFPLFFPFDRQIPLTCYRRQASTAPRSRRPPSRFTRKPCGWWRSRCRTSTSRCETSTTSSRGQRRKMPPTKSAMPSLYGNWMPRWNSRSATSRATSRRRLTGYSTSARRWTPRHRAWERPSARSRRRCAGRWPSFGRRCKTRRCASTNRPDKRRKKESTRIPPHYHEPSRTRPYSPPSAIRPPPRPAPPSCQTRTRRLSGPPPGRPGPVPTLPARRACGRLTRTWGRQPRRTRYYSSQRQVYCPPRRRTAAMRPCRCSSQPQTRRQGRRGWRRKSGD